MQKQSSSQARQHIEKHKAILDERRHELETRLRAIEGDFEQPRNPDDDRATERNNDEVLEELGEAGQIELLAVQAALDRIQAGTFGACVKCGKLIGETRLKAVPHTPFCQSCASASARKSESIFGKHDA
ncbi:TraR/DksA family transcriptional regulator [Rhizobium leguminosarum]|uniref:TraR/DksA family transcriptional regulator n=1 Tax=Rhizobium leguminosarum TaxID=384 RepID=UPI001C940E55|nr:TraR/DksA C4-type zinc finger protein [Rhizobium leguminosarum]MBY5412224.1 TraR/DksA family transcriptional regulator [Rhizobium leguminosarum]